MEINKHENKTWIRELVSADEQIEKSVMIDMNLGLDTQRILVNETITFLFTSNNGFGYHGDNNKIETNEPLICTVTLNDFKPEDKITPQ